MKLKFTPSYTVSYNGAFHRAGVPFEIDHKDRNEMERHGTVESPVKSVDPISGLAEEDKPVKKPGRPKKVSE